MTIHEELKKIDDLKQHKRKVDGLKELGYVAKQIVSLNYANHLNWNMPTGAPPYNENEEGSVPKAEDFSRGLSSIFNQKNHQWAREKVLIDMLQYLNKEDSEILIAVKDKELTKIFPTITEELVKEAL